MRFSIRKRTLVILVVVALLLVAGGALWLSEDTSRAASRYTAELAGEVAAEVMERASDLHQQPVAVRQVAEQVYQATGVANTQLIVAGDSGVVFDTGLSIQGAKQRRLLLEAAPVQAISHVILSHSHQDHVGGAQFWIEDGTELVAHRQYPEEQRYLKELEPLLWHRNRLFFPWIPESPPQSGFMRYGHLVPNRLVADGEVYRFERGGVRFEIHPTPGAEGADNLCLWLPDQKILFTGDFFGPLFPQFPNIFTMRGEKVRKPIEYIASLNRMIALAPQMLVPSHFDPVSGAENIRASMVRIRDAVQHVHDVTIAGMNAGKSLHQLMEEISLPEHLSLSQGHGRVSWAVRSIWEYYATWFQYQSTTELYPVPVTAIHPELAGLVGADALAQAARAHIAEQRPVHALHLLDIALNGDPAHTEGLRARREALHVLLTEAREGLRNTYEITWLEYRIARTEEALSAAGQP